MSPSVSNIPKFELQIEYANSNSNGILCHVVDKDAPDPSTTCIITGVVRRKQKEPDFILRNEKDKKGHVIVLVVPTQIQHH